MFTSSANLASVAPPKLPALLHRIGRYELIAKIGNGGMADVYLARLAGNDGAALQKLVVVKLIRSELSAEPEFIEMFMDEARVAGRLNHPNVIQTLEVGADAGRHYLEMEYVDGQPVNRVARVLLRHPGFDLSARLTIVLRTLLGLYHLHELPDARGGPEGQGRVHGARAGARGQRRAPRGHLRRRRRHVGADRRPPPVGRRQPPRDPDARGGGRHRSPQPPVHAGAARAGRDLHEGAGAEARGALRHRGAVRVGSGVLRAPAAEPEGRARRGPPAGRGVRRGSGARAQGP